MEEFMEVKKLVTAIDEAVEKLSCHNVEVEYSIDYQAFMQRVMTEQTKEKGNEEN